MVRFETRPGFTLGEVFISLILIGLVTAALMRLFVDQSKFFTYYDAVREARSSARSAHALLTSELRMVEGEAGVDSATWSMLQVRVPYHFGLPCSDTAVAMLPMDSAIANAGQLSGYAWSDDGYDYTYVDNSVTIGTLDAGACDGTGFDTMTDATVIGVSPSLPNDAVGNPFFLYQTVRYELAASQNAPGYLGLYRTTVANDSTEEIAFPFDSAQSAFRFYVGTADTARDVPPSDLDSIYGVQFVLLGRSERSERLGNVGRSGSLTTAVFFKNRDQ